MKRSLWWALLATVLVASACQSPTRGGAAPLMAMRMEASTPAAVVAPDQARMLIWRAYLTVEVANLSNAVERTRTALRDGGGFVEREWNADEKSVSLTLRVPMAAFSNTLSGLEQLGDLQSRNVSSDDVTEQYVDTDARLKNMVALRDRLRELLVKATEVKDLLAIETELGRVQGEIEAMEARLRTLKGQVDLAEINVTFTRKPLLGPLGYLAKGAWWLIEKLFVIRP